MNAEFSLIFLVILFNVSFFFQVSGIPLVSPLLSTNYWVFKQQHEHPPSLSLEEKHPSCKRFFGLDMPSILSGLHYSAEKIALVNCLTLKRSHQFDVYSSFVIRLIDCAHLIRVY